jgi:hypothetical protein
VRLHPARSLSAPLQVQLTEYVMDMRLDRGETDVEVAGNLFIAEPLPISRTISSSRGDNTGVAFLSCIVPKSSRSNALQQPSCDHWGAGLPAGADIREQRLELGHSGRTRDVPGNTGLGPDKH